MKKSTNKTSAKRSATTQTVKINGARVRLVTKDGKVTAKPAAPLEWELQASAVRRLRGIPQYALDAESVRPGMFTLAGDFNAARRSMSEAAKAKATGLTPGEHDLRVYLYGGRLGLIEMKGEAPISKDQRARHALLRALGFTLQDIVRATTCEEAADKAVAMVRGWLAQTPTATLTKVA